MKICRVPRRTKSPEQQVLNASRMLKECTSHDATSCHFLLVCCLESLQMKTALLLTTYYLEVVLLEGPCGLCNSWLARRRQCTEQKGKQWRRFSRWTYPVRCSTFLGLSEHHRVSSSIQFPGWQACPSLPSLSRPKTTASKCSGLTALPETFGLLEVLQGGLLGAEMSWQLLIKSCCRRESVGQPACILARKLWLNWLHLKRFEPVAYPHISTTLTSDPSTGNPEL